jgi:hypothetical protein
MKAISLGWGTQSFTLAAMVALGELEPVDVAIHADTTHERSETYTFAARWAPWLEERGVKVVTVQADDAEPVDRFGGLMLPAYMTTPKGQGRFDRQCTDNWKRKPIRRWLQANREKQTVEMWLGISMDEYQRMKDSDVKYIVHRWPLIEKRITRNACREWLTAHGLEIPVKSGCTFCPFHNTPEWKEIKASGNGDWTEAVNVDRAIRKSRPPYDLFIHPARIPLEDVDLRTPQDKGQLELDLWSEECSGICGV